MWLNISASDAALAKDVGPERDQAAAKLTPLQLTTAQALSSKCVASRFKDCAYQDATESVQAQATAKSPEHLASAAPVKQINRTRQLFATGSGFYVSGDGQVVTNAHVVQGCAEMRSASIGPIRTVAIDPQSDLALLATNNKPKVFAQLQGGRGARLGENVIAVGFPLHGLLSSDPIVTTGTISALSGMNNDRRSVQISAPVQPGNSGGPLLGDTGSVVGVIVGKLNALRVAGATGDIPQNVNFAVSLGTLQSFLNANGVAYGLTDATALRTSADIAASASRYTVLLECWK
jgi:S1-C subfamily serine protease